MKARRAKPEPIDPLSIPEEPGRRSMILPRVREERLKRGWSQTRLSALTGIAATDLGAIERGVRYPFPGWRRRIAAAFKLPEAELFPPDSGRPRL